MSGFDKFWNYLVSPLAFTVIYTVIWGYFDYLPENHIELGILVFLVAFFASYLHTDERVN